MEPSGGTNPPGGTSPSGRAEPRAGTEPHVGANPPRKVEPPGGTTPRARTLPRARTPPRARTLQSGGDTPTKKLVVEFLEGDWYEGDTFEDLVADLLPGYEEEEAATQWHMRRQWARAMSARMQALFEADVTLDWTSAQSLIETAAQGRVCALYDNLGAETS